LEYLRAKTDYFKLTARLKISENCIMVAVILRKVTSLAVI